MNEQTSGRNASPASARKKRDRGPMVLTAVIIFLFLVLSVVFTRPMLTKGDHAVYKDPYDTTFQAWTLAWDIHALSENPLDLFNTNIYYPNPYTLAYSEHQITTAVMAIPLMAITGNPVQTANYMLIFNLFLCALGAYLLTRRLTGNRTAGVVAGIIFAFAPPRLAHMGHLQLSAACWIPLSLLFLHRYSEEGRTRDAALFALFFLLQTLATWYYGIILAVAVLIFLAVRLVMNRKGFTVRWTGVFLLSVLVALLLITPFAIPYLKVQKDEPRFEREIEEVDLFSADVRDFAIAPTENLVWGRLTAGLRETTEERGGETERSLFPGLVPLVLGVAGAVLLFRRGKGKERFFVRYYVAIAVASFVLCLGSSLYFFGHRLNVPMPYELFYYLFPGFKVIRVPGRFIILVILSLAVLSGFAVKAVIGRVSSWRGEAAPAVAALLVVGLLLVDLMSATLPMYAVPLADEFPPVYTWLEGREGEAPTVEMPLAEYDKETFEWGLQYEETWPQREPMRAYYSTLHWKKIFNGYSGFIPSSYYDGVFATRDFPSSEAIDFFKAEGVEYMIIHGALYDPLSLQEIIEWMSDHDSLELIERFGDDYVYRLKR
ncbi:MAG: hypothetical protein KKB90_00650 [Actinobacteria bacterium]|nr:hypothetical protein [Actinomycetota bacterium]MCG2817812.1 hypothetical protein [Actinomycetes bacterium]MBU4178553.1 hypothetical protein [Actinomycetota bacterium]MBU4217457.1 hypothetical protein [Actinomycetota bacterium]MBU4359407.1 hypothetical protein [Actinomycetota bacterium]